jgi:hypothetical protein
MERTTRYDFETGRYAYGEIERGLGVTLGADEAAQKGALRGRLKHLSTLGLPSSGPGKGARRSYSEDEALQLLLALLLADLGIDPALIVPAIKKVWPKLHKRIRMAAAAPVHNPTMLTVRLAEVSGPWGAKEPLWIGVMPRRDERSQAFAKKHGFRDESDNLMTTMDWDESDWFCARNLTTEVAKLQAALDAEASDVGP